MGVLGAGSDSDEAMTKEEISQEEAAAEGVAEPSEPQPKPKILPVSNAFTRLMAPKPKPQPQPQPQPQISKSNPFKSRMALGAYLKDPASYPSEVVYHTDDFVVLRDKYPKATIHVLILPRSSRYSLLHPFDALADPELLAKVQAEVVKVRALVAKELQRRLGRYSRADAARQAVLDGDAEPEVESGGAVAQLPSGRDWDAEVKSGIHLVPSMSHLHIHVISRDMHSPALRHRKHYNSFNTPFLVDVDEFPLHATSPRRHPKEEAYMKRDLQCWRCGKNFGNHFKQLKDHLDDEFEAWKTE